MTTLVFDVETSRYPDGNAYRPTNQMISWATYDGQKPLSGYYTDADFSSRLQEQITRAKLIVGLNLKFDVAWARRYKCVIPKGCRIYDLQVSEFCMSGQTNSFASMDELCLRYGITGKQGGLEEYWNQGIDTPDIPKDVVTEYNAGDVQRTYSIYEAQLRDERMTPELHKLVLLMGADLLVLQLMEENGLKYDVGRSQEVGEKLQKELASADLELCGYAGDIHGFNLSSGDHLSAFLYGGSISLERYEPVNLVYQSGPRKGQDYTQNRYVQTEVFGFKQLFKPLRKTEVAKSTLEKPLYQTNEPVLKQLKANSKKQQRVIELLLKRAELAKLVDTYFLKLPQRLKEMGWGDIVHGTYNQVVARTGRLSSSAPNMQNNPEVVDRMFITRYD